MKTWPVAQHEAVATAGIVNRPTSGPTTGTTQSSRAIGPGSAGLFGGALGSTGLARDAPRDGRAGPAAGRDGASRLIACKGSWPMVLLRRAIADARWAVRPRCYARSARGGKPGLWINC